MYLVVVILILFLYKHIFISYILCYLFINFFMILINYSNKIILFIGSSFIFIHLL